MKPATLLPLTLTLALLSCSDSHQPATPVGTPTSQVPTWNTDDLAFYLHGSMSTEFAPEPVLRAFIATYPDLFPSPDFSHLGAIPDPNFGWPVGFTRANPKHLAGLPSLGINCAACHTADIQALAPADTKASPGPTTRILGVTALFDSDAFFGSIILATFKTQEPANMQRFLAQYVDQYSPQPDPARRAARLSQFNNLWQTQYAAIVATMSADPAGSRDAGPGGLQSLTIPSLQLATAQIESGSPNLAQLAANMLKLFHNMRTSLHIPDQPPASPPPISGPGRNDAFGLLSAGLLNSPQPFAPVKFGLVWDVDKRQWVHWDGNTRQPIARNLLAVAGLGAPQIGREVLMSYPLVQRHTDLTEKIAAPRYPFPIDKAAAQRGQPLYQANCASCHTGPEDDHRLYAPEVVGTDPLRAKLFTQPQADALNIFLADLQTPGYTPPPPAEPGIRSTQKYFSPSLAGVWARSPYLHNGSVRTMTDLLTPPAQRPTSFHRGTNLFDTTNLGYLDQGYYLLDTKSQGSSNSGHDYATNLTPTQKHDLIEFLKTQ